MKRKEIEGIKELIPTIQEAIEYCKITTFDNVIPLIDDIVEALQRIVFSTNNEDLEKHIVILKTKSLEKLNIEFYDSLSNTLLNILKYLTSIKKEVVFLPYNASMWDSLESIWLAAKEDERCNCFVIPIPYFNKNVDGSLSDIIYEGDKFPEYVPITHYLEYNINDKNPDVIYFHNPYDNYNRVTTVHPDYYSSNLKKHTDMLVYIPYFIVNNKLKQEYCVLPGIKNADFVIVQSEEVAEQYKEYYLYQDRDKFLPLGSPKIDKAILTSEIKSKELDIPLVWQEKIQGKKVILYNTHIYSIMNNGEQLIKKIEYVFSVFEKQKDFILLWRPHPLSEEAAAAINPKILNKFKEIEKKAKQYDFCIFDETSNLHRSIAISDAYYGDRSSLVELYRTLDKPVMIQNVVLQKETLWEDLNRIPFEDAYIDEKNIWFSSSSFNGLFSMNKETGKTSYIGIFPGEKVDGDRLFSKVANANNKLYFIPCNATCIMEFSLETKEFRRIEIKDDEKPRKFLSYSIYKDYIYIMPRSYESVLRYNFKTDILEYMSDWDSEIKKYDLEKNVWFRDIIQKDSILYCPFFQKNLMFKFDLSTETMEVLELGDEKDIYMSVQYDGEKFWLIPKNSGRIACWDENNNEITYLEDYPSDFKVLNTQVPFLTSMIKDEMLWVLPCFSNSILIIDTKTKMMKAMIYGNKKFDVKMRNYMFWEFGGIKSFDDDAILFPINRDDILICSENGELILSQKSEIPKDYKKRETTKHFARNEFGDYIEEEYFGLSEYIKQNNHENKMNAIKKEKQETSGKIINDFFLS